MANGTAVLGRGDFLTINAGFLMLTVELGG
jgi:hypothetical protein